MPKHRITATTDGLHIGTEIDVDAEIIPLGPDKRFRPRKKIIIPGGVRIASRNYIIDTIEVRHGNDK